MRILFPIIHFQIAFSYISKFISFMLTQIHVFHGNRHYPIKIKQNVGCSWAERVRFWPAITLMSKVYLQTWVSSRITSSCFEAILVNISDTGEQSSTPKRKVSGLMEEHQAQVDKAGNLKGSLKEDTIWLNGSPESPSVGFMNSGRRAKWGLIMFRLTLQFKCLMFFQLLFFLSVCFLVVFCLWVSVLIMKGIRRSRVMNVFLIWVLWATIIFLSFLEK